MSSLSSAERATEPSPNSGSKAPTESSASRRKAMFPPLPIRQGGVPGSNTWKAPPPS